jgi:adenylate kinase
MNRTIIVTGIPGTGKTTVCSFVEKLAKGAGFEVNVINYGTVMMGVLQSHGQAIQRDAMRKDSVDTQRKLQREVAEAVTEKIRALKGLTVIDTHMSIKTPEGYLPGLPYSNLQLLKPKMLVLVEAEPREISSRRMKDPSRKRDATVEDSVKEELLFSRLMACACAVLASAPVKIVINAEGKQEEAAREILSAVRVK